MWNTIMTVNLLLKKKELIKMGSLIKINTYLAANMTTVISCLRNLPLKMEIYKSMKFIVTLTNPMTKKASID